MSLFTLSSYRTSTCKASASPPAVVISRATVVMVLSGELGSGGKGVLFDGSLVDFAATTTFFGNFVNVTFLDWDRENG